VGYCIPRVCVRVNKFFEITQRFLLETYKNSPAVIAPTLAVWRTWLSKNHDKEKSAWLIIFRKATGKKCVDYNEAVEEALCFGWIDSTANPRDEESSYRYFAVRKPNSKWSKVNRERVARLIKEKRMMPAGQSMIELAKKTGTWTAMEEIERGVIPPDLQKELTKNKKGKENFNSFPPSSKKIILSWIKDAKTRDTRQKRIRETVKLAAKNLRANHYVAKRK
jgi:uncharacterized protein YdeI (YjbR/CyaY-like superfamily)